MTRLYGRIRARRIHRRALTAWAEDDRQEAVALAEQALAMVPAGHRLASATERTNVLFTLAGLSAEVPAHRTVAKWLHQAADELRAVPESSMRSRWLTEVLTRLGDSQRLAGDYDEARTTLQHAHAAAQDNDTDCLALASVHNTLGILAKETGRYAEAADHYDAALQLMVDECGDDDPCLAGLHHNLAGLAHIQGHYEAAEQSIRTALALRARSDPPDAAGYAADTSVLGAVLAGCGRLKESEQFLLEVKALWEDLRGPNHYEVAVQLHILASVHQQRGQLTAATNSYSRALQIKHDVLGGQHPEVAALHHNLACLLADRGERAYARAHFDTALGIYAATVGPNYPDAQVCAARRERLTASQ